MSSDKTKSQVIDSWFCESETDLQCAKILHDKGFFARSLYHLQQSNEKLAKGLLLSIGIQTPKKRIQDETIKSILGFKPKEPKDYRHRTFHSFISDISKVVPALDDLTKLIDYEDEDIIAEFQKSLKKSKKGIQKLQKKPFSLVASSEQLGKEIKMLNLYLDNLDQIKDKTKLKLEKLDSHKIIRTAIRSAQKQRLKVTSNQAATSYHTAIESLVPVIELSFLVVFSVAAASFLDPLESITRYPNSTHGAFNQEDPYVKNFDGLHQVVAKILQKSRKMENESETNKEKTN